MIAIEGELMAKDGNGSGGDPYLYAPPFTHAGVTYGPRTISTWAKHHAQHRDWSFRVATPSKAARSASADELRRWMREPDGTLRIGLPEGETRVYLLLVEAGHSERFVARKLGLSRRTVRSYLSRLAQKAGQENS